MILTDDEIKTWQQRLEETCPALGPMHIHACVEEVNDAMQAEINDLRVALQEQAREGEAVANSAILARGRFHAFKGEDGEPDDWEWFEEGTNCEHGCIDAVIVRADAIAAPQPAQPESIECDCGRIHKKTRYGWACSEPEHGHAIGCENNPVDIAIKAEAAHGIGGAL